MKSYLLPLLFLLFFALPARAYSFFKYQGYLYGEAGVSRVYVDRYDGGYAHVPAVFGLGQRLNWHMGRHMLGFGFNAGAGYGSSLRRGFDPRGGSLFALDLILSYGLTWGKYKEHQMTVIGGTVSPRFHGVAERNSYREIGGTEIRYYEGTYAMLLLGLELLSYRWVKGRFTAGFSHRVLFLTAGHENINYPERYRVLAGYGYEFCMELGFSFGLPREETGGAGLVPGLFVKYLEVGQRESLSVTVVSEDKEAVFMDMDIYLGRKSIAFARNIPVFAGRAQFTKHLKRGLLKEGDRVMVYYTVKDGEGGILSSHSNAMEVRP